MPPVNHDIQYRTLLICEEEFQWRYFATLMTAKLQATRGSEAPTHLYMSPRRYHDFEVWLMGYQANLPPEQRVFVHPLRFQSAAVIMMAGQPDNEIWFTNEAHPDKPHLNVLLIVGRHEMVKSLCEERVPA